VKKFSIYTIFSIILPIFLFFPFTARAQVVINEISPSEEWIELFNTSSSEVVLDGCILNMGNSGQDINFTSSDVVSASGYKVAEKNITPDWTSNWLNNSGDSVSLTCPSLSGDSVSFGSDVDPATYGRSPNGSGGFLVLASATKGSANPDPTPTPTPTPEPTATPTPAPAAATSSPTLTPTPTPTKSPTPIPTKTKTPVPTVTPEETAASSNLVLGLQEAGMTPTAVATSEAKSNFPLLSVVFILGGLICIGGAIVGIIKKNEKLPENS
jgi:hypothetical protein